MCFLSDSQVVVSDASRLTRRWYQGPLATLAVPGGTVRATVGQPVLTQRGWVSAGAVEAGDFVVAADNNLARPVQAWWDEAAARWWQMDVAPSSRGFWGDADGAFPTLVIDPDGPFSAASGPMTAQEGDQPDADPVLVRGVLGVLSTPEAFGVSSWAQATSRVPGVAGMWSDGEPTRRGHGVPAGLRARLGDAVATLPEPAVDTAGLASRLVGAPVPLRLARVESTARGFVSGWAFNAASPSGALLVDGVVTGTLR